MARPKTISGELTPVQIRILPSLKETLTAQASALGKSFNTHVADTLAQSFAVPATATLDQSETITEDMSEVNITHEMTREEALQRWPDLALPPASMDLQNGGIIARLPDLPWPPVVSPWFSQLEILKLLPKASQGRVFMAIVKESSATLQLPEGFRDMTQADKAAWLDTNCPLGGV